MRRRVAVDPTDSEAIEALVALAQAGVPGAHPDEWYGVQPPSTEAPLVDIASDPQASVPVSPSQVESIEKCPLNWLVSRLGGGEGDYRADIGTLLHHALETVPGVPSADQILEIVRSEWGSLRFDAVWQEQRALGVATEMATSLADYLAVFDRSGQQLLATEAEFELPIEFARLRGKADRLEAVVREDGIAEVAVVDLKTGARKPTAAELEQHAQLQAYQLGVIRGAFAPEGENAANAGAKLVYIHPDAVTQTQRKRGESYTVFAQQGLDDEQQRVFEERVLEVARTAAGSRFVARLEHHCEDANAQGKACRLHIIPAVSRA